MYVDIHLAYRIVQIATTYIHNYYEQCSVSYYTYVWLSLDFQLNFKSQSYFLAKENMQPKSRLPVLELTYPSNYSGIKVFPIIVVVDEIDVTAIGKLHISCMLLNAQHILFYY